MAEEMTTDERVGRLDMKHGFVKQIIRNQVSRDEYDKEVKISTSKPHKKTKHAATRESQSYYLPPRLRKKSGETGVTKDVKEEKCIDSKDETGVISRDTEGARPPETGVISGDTEGARPPESDAEFVQDKLFKLEYVDQHGQVHNRVVYIGENAEDIARELATKTNLPDDLCAHLKVKILNNITAFLEKNY